jgi:hypothetical protein
MLPEIPQARYALKQSPAAPEASLVIDRVPIDASGARDL